MEPAFWLDRWRQDEIGFHQEGGNPLLRQYWPALGVAAGARVFVPLCGKTPDLAWLAARGHEVVGVELSEKAVRAFFSAQGLAAESRREGAFTVWTSGGISLWAGDFFQLPKAVLAGCSACYDRAALIALPPPLRRAYAARLCADLPPTARALLVTLQYPEQDMAGPPFSLAEAEIDALFGRRFALQRVHQREALEDNPGLRQRGLTRLCERVHLLLPPAGALVGGQPRSDD